MSSISVLWSKINSFTSPQIQRLTITSVSFEDKELTDISLEELEEKWLTERQYYQDLYLYSDRV